MIKTFQGGEHRELNLPNELLTADKAIDLAKQKIDRGGMSQGSA